MKKKLSLFEDLLAQKGILYSDDPDLCHTYSHDWTTRFKSHTPLVLFPRNTHDVSTVLTAANTHNIKIIASGGRTGLASGAVATQNEVILSLRDLNFIGEIDPIAMTVRVGAGVIHDTLQKKCGDHGVMWPIHLASHGSCMIGGNIATNAGGLHVIHYGHVRHWVQSLEVVLPTGEILELNGELEKNNSGFDLRQLMIGSEGTLGVLTAATLKLTKIPKKTSVCLFSIHNVGTAFSLLKLFRERFSSLHAAELLSQLCMESVCEAHKLPSFEPQGSFYVLFEMEDEPDETFLEKVLNEDGVVGGTLATDESNKRRLWKYREGITESLSLRGDVYKNDLAVPLSKFEPFMTDLARKAPALYQGSEVFLFGHFGDGNIHINVVNSSERKKEDFFTLCEASNDPLYSLLQKYGGSIAAEHGIGLLKKKYLHYTRSKDEIRLYQELKKVFDPHSVLNPQKIFDLTAPE